MRRKTQFSLYHVILYHVAIFLDYSTLIQSTKRTQVNKKYDSLFYMAVNLNVENKQLR